MSSFSGIRFLLLLLLLLHSVHAIDTRNAVHLTSYSLNIIISIKYVVVIWMAPPSSAGRTHARPPVSTSVVLLAAAVLIIEGSSMHSSGQSCHVIHRGALGARRPCNWALLCALALSWKENIEPKHNCICNVSLINYPLLPSYKWVYIVSDLKKRYSHSEF